MSVDSRALMLNDTAEKYEVRPSSPAFARLYEGAGRWGTCSLYCMRNSMVTLKPSTAASTTRHYWAIPSREFIDLIKDLKEDLYALKRGGVDAKLVDSYQQAIERCQPCV